MAEKKDLKIKKKKKPNYILIVGLIVIFIPVIFLGVILLGSLEKKGEPVVENRFNSQLDPAITEEQIASLNQITIEGMESISVNLKTGTVRVLVDMKDDATADEIEAARTEVVSKIKEQLPIETYFTNTATVKMYDLEVNVFNYIANDENRDGYLHYAYTKTGAAEKGSNNTISSPRDKDVANELLNPDTSGTE
ncbi:MAG: hypothetical protein ACRCZJ_08395 [Erysipelotrichaceae bacterium]